MASLTPWFLGIVKGFGKSLELEKSNADAFTFQMGEPRPERVRDALSVTQLVAVSGGGGAGTSTQAFTVPSGLWVKPGVWAGLQARPGPSPSFW